jgi:hypothetical protein
MQSQAVNERKLDGTVLPAGKLHITLTCLSWEGGAAAPAPADKLLQGERTERENVRLAHVILGVGERSLNGGVGSLESCMGERRRAEETPADGGEGASLSL